MNRRAISILALATAAAPSGALAQDAFDLGTIVVSANLEETGADRTGASVSVVTEEDLARTGEVRVIDYLARLPGVSVRTAGPAGTQGGIGIRGASQNYVAVFVDGIDVTDPSSTQIAYDFGGLTTADISRIEVLRGSQSALYGSSAVGGVISITTKRATEEGTFQQMAAEAGSYNTARLSYSYQRKAGPTDVAVSLGHVETAGFSAADEADGNTEADGFRSDRVSVSFGHELQNGMRLSFSAFAERSSGQYDEGFPLGDGTPNEEVDARQVGLRAAAEFDLGGVESTLALSRYDIERVYTDDFGGSAFDGTRTSLSYKGALDISDATRAVFGAEVSRESYADSFGTGIDRTLSGIFGELSFAPRDDLDVTATLRHDRNSDFGGFTTGRLSVAYRPAENWVLRGVAATGFRAPSPYEQLGPFGDPTLEPEESQSLEFGAEYDDGTLNIGATAFLLEAENLIDFDLGTNLYAQVPGTSRRKGVEVEAGYAVSERLRLSAAYTYTDNAASTATSWALVPRHQATVGIDADLTDRLAASLTIQHGADRANLPDYTVANANLNYDVSDGVEAYLRVDNLFDEQYQLVPGYGTSDRAFYVGLRTSF